MTRRNFLAALVGYTTLVSIPIQHSPKAQQVLFDRMLEVTLKRYREYLVEDFFKPSPFFYSLKNKNEIN